MARAHGNYDLVGDYIATAQPGFINFNCPVTPQRGFYLGNRARRTAFATPSGKAKFSASRPPEALIPQLHGENASFTLQILQARDQYNTIIYGLYDRYCGVSGQ